MAQVSWPLRLQHKYTGEWFNFLGWNVDLLSNENHATYATDDDAIRMVIFTQEDLHLNFIMQ